MVFLRSLLLAACLIPTICIAQSVPLCPSVLLFHKAHHRSGVEQLQKVAALGFTKVNLVVTLRCEIDESGRVRSYGRVKRGRYLPLNDALLADSRQELLAVCREAKRLGFQLSIVPHLDSAGELYEWRNHFDFDPLKFYQGYSYDQAMLGSIVAALSESGYGESSYDKPDTRDSEVDFALGGEMGRSVFLYPESYGAILKQLRNDQRLQNTRWGISLNFTEVAGKAESEEAKHASLQSVFDQCDFLGLSNYRPFELPPNPAHFAQSATGFLTELAAHKIVVPETMPLHFSEIALGGGSAEAPVAKTASDAAATPWEGSADPQQNPWDDPALQELRVQYHAALLKFLAEPLSYGDELKNPITAAYLWCEGSWDPLDIAEDGFASKRITSVIQRHNAQARSKTFDGNLDQ